MKQLKNIISGIFITASLFAFQPLLAEDEVCYVAVQSSSETFDREKLANVSIALISQFLQKVHQIPSGGASPDACFYEVFFSQESSGVLVALRGEGLNGYANSPQGSQHALLSALYRALPDKRQLICQSYQNEVSQCQPQPATQQDQPESATQQVRFSLNFSKAPDPQTNEDLAKLLQQAQQEDQAKDQLQKIKAEWKFWQQQMQTDFDKIQQIQQVSTKLRIQTWQQFLQSYQANNPFSTDDEKLRNTADEQLTHWQSQPQEMEQTPTTLPPPPPPNANRENPQVVKLYKRYLLATKKKLTTRADSARQKIIDDYPESGYARNFVIDPIQTQLQTKLQNQTPLDDSLRRQLNTLKKYHAQHPHVIALFAMAIQLELMEADQLFQNGYPNQMQENWKNAEHWGKRFSATEQTLQKRKIKLAQFRSLIRQNQLDAATDFVLDWEIEGDDPQFFNIAQIDLLIAQGNHQEASQMIQKLKIAGVDPQTIASLQNKLHRFIWKFKGHAGWSRRRNHTSVVFQNKIWVLGGNDGSFKNDVWSSSDGKTWTQETYNARWSGRFRHTSVVFNGKIWVLGGNDGSFKNDVWSSSDGKTWTQETYNARWSRRFSHTSVMFNGKIWVLGGNDGSFKNDVWSSSDGKTWTQETYYALWSRRTLYTSVVFNGKIWVLGGHDGRGKKNDVWSSSDGKTWTQETYNALWSGRFSHTSVMFNRKIWVLGGNDGSFKNDVWSSSDGKTWKKEANSAGWSGRFSHTSVVFQNKIWVLGGDDGNRKNDVWAFESPFE